MARALTRVFVWVFVAIIRIYQVVMSPWLGAACRFEPSCSEYAIAAFQTHGVTNGGWLIVRRLSRCHPMGGDGFDPVPERGASGP